MKISTIFRRAAEIMHARPSQRQLGACSALLRAAGELGATPIERTNCVVLMENWFARDGRAAGLDFMYWGMNFITERYSHLYVLPPVGPEVRSARTLMLLFLAHIADDEVGPP